MCVFVCVCMRVSFYFKFVTVAHTKFMSITSEANILRLRQGQSGVNFFN